MKQHEIPGHVAITAGNDGMPKINVKTISSAAEIYLHGAHVTGFQKNGEPPLLFLSRQSVFAADKPIRGGVPICFPWFGARENSAAHGLARLVEWQMVESAVRPDGSVALNFMLPENELPKAGWPAAKVNFIVTVGEQLTMELLVANSSAQDFVFEGCLHTYFAVGDIAEVSVAGLKGVHYLDKVEAFARKLETANVIRVGSEVDRVYLDAPGKVEIRDAELRRTIFVEKSGSASTVVWNPWADKAKAMTDFGRDEFRKMICVESGNVGQGKIALTPGRSASLKVILSSAPLT